MSDGRPWRLIAIDLDGTLLDSQHRLPDVNRDALHRAHAAGLKIVLCTGRAFTETRPVIADIGLDLDATVTVFGALVTDVATGRTLARRAIDLSLARAATAWFQERDYAVLWLADADAAGFDGYVLDGPRRHPAVDRWMAKSSCVVREVRALPADAPPPVRLSVIDDEAALAPVSAALRAAFDGRLVHNVLHAPPYNLSLVEVFAAGVSKWAGLLELCRRWNIDPRQTVAVGDDVNDLEMVQSAGLGVAMENANPRLRAVARHVTASNDAGGVARLIDELLSGRHG